MNIVHRPANTNAPSTAMSPFDPPEPDDTSRLQDLAAQVLLARYHLNRLPLHLLLPTWSRAPRRPSGGRRRRRPAGPARS